MRYIPSGKLEPGMIVGRDICNGEGRLILGKNCKLDEEYQKKLLEWGTPGIYIEDAFTEDIQVPQIIRPEVEREALKMIHDLFMTDIKNPTSQEDIQQAVVDMVTDVMANRDVMYNIMDTKASDDYTYFHCTNSAIFAAVVGAYCDLPKYDMINLVTAAILHDVGKRFVDIDVLNAKRALTEEERIMIIQHPKLGFEFLKDHYEFSADVYKSVLQHHEWYNGQGYPLRYSGDDIPLYARIIKLADVYDALVSKRSYHELIPPFEALEYIEENSEVEFDPNLVEIFKKKVAAYPVGCEVRLSDNRTAIVMENYEDFMLRPKIKVIPTGEVMELKDDACAHITIQELLI